MINNGVVHGIGVPNYSNDCKGIISMDIYSPIVITEAIKVNFRPTRLYIKELQGLKYFGKSILVDIDKYSGSGTRWVNHVNKYGKTNIKTLWVSEWFTDPCSLQEFALNFSRDNHIVESNEWANLSAENGLSGGHFNLAAKSDDERKQIYKKVRQTFQNKTPEEKQQRSDKHTKTLTHLWENKTQEQRKLHATNTSIGLKQMWNEMSEDEKAARKHREMATKNSKSPDELAEISRKQKESRQRLVNRPNVLKLKELCESKNIKLGKNWRAKPNEWIDAKLAELTKW